MAALSVDGIPMPALPNSADQINYDNTTSGLSATTVKGAVDELASEKQDKSDNSLQTTDKTIPGAINELKSGLTKVTLLSPTLATSTETTYEMTDSISKYMMIVACIGFDQYRFQGSITMPIVNTMQYYDVANGDGSKTIGFAFVDATHVKMSGDWYLSIYGIMPIYG